jgi:hypothetical protein
MLVGRQAVSLTFDHLRIVGGVAFDTVSGRFHRVNDTAAFILEQMKRRAPVPDIILQLADTFDIPIETAARDVEHFMAGLLKEKQK